MHRSGLAAACAVLALCVAPASASADLYRCTGPDGRPTFTDKKGACPGAQKFEPESVVHTAPTPAKRPPAAVDHHRKLLEGTDRIGLREWQQKKRSAEERLAHIQKKRELMRPYVTHCNRGGYITTRDEAGIADTVSCSALKKDFAALDDEEAAAREHLEHGLAEECRRAGCQPGWLR